MKKAIIIICLLIAGGAVALAFRKPGAPRQSISNLPLAPPNPPPVVVIPKPVPLDLKGKQVIVFAFDGSKSLDMWRKSLDFAQTMAHDGKPIHFTYFISGVYLLSYNNRGLYHPPGFEAGTSHIGYADSNNDIINRIRYINRALAEGHEIGSHLNGHFNGGSWSAADWEQEFSEFDKIISNINANNNISANEARLNIGIKDIIGFRAPDLGVNESLWPVLKKHGIVYDTSTIGKLGDKPYKDANGFWRFPIPSIQYGNTNRSLLSMDYNFYYRQTNAVDILHAGTPAWQQAEDDMYLSYVNYFKYNYNMSKTPVFIAHHFSEWNDGVYWEAMKKFAQEECGKQDVSCVSYKEFVDYLNIK
ncbi:MAG TPA: hypothetical protein VF974_05670 [Patescibacteria group bacterium]